jgi:DNA-binding NarL/FixJ family response regulator
LFGQLQTLGEDESDVKRREKLAEDVAAIKAAIDGGVLLPPSVRAMVSKSENQSQEPSDK